MLVTLTILCIGLFLVGERYSATRNIFSPILSVIAPPTAWVSAALAIKEGQVAAGLWTSFFAIYITWVAYEVIKERIRPWQQRSVNLAP